jgi:hypothetical protein|tara:strand:- start:3812 stop:4051 length:240 start_codon:yes stop_codon:yes gene_type:complete
MLNLKLIIEIPVDGQSTKTTKGDITQHTEELKVLIENWCRNTNAVKGGTNEFFGPPTVFKFLYDIPDSRQRDLELDYED